MNENERTVCIAKAAAHALQTGTRRTVFCKGCKTAFLSGPANCAKCGRPATEDEILKHIESSMAYEITSESMDQSIPESPKFAPRVPGKRGPSEKLYTYKGEQLTLAQLSERYGMAKDTLRLRLNYGWDMELALTEPVHTKKAALVKRTSQRISHPDYVLEAKVEARLVDVTPTPVCFVNHLEKKVMRADDVASIDPKFVEETPAKVKLIRERCARLDEIDYEISLLRVERSQLIAKLEGK
jgi:hypothetical protein